MDEYKSRNYAQTVPSRFIKDMRKATDVDGDNKITMDEMRHMLKNIEARDKFSDEELESLFDEVGDDSNGERVIHVEDMLQAWKEHVK
jgi:Ca2+-binding EF-hand superfamily protein